jgi:putative membrane protein
VELGFGAAEIFKTEWVFKLIFSSNYLDTKDSPVWQQTRILTKNIGLYNWFLVAGIVLTMLDMIGGPGGAIFFTLCVAIAGAYGLWSIGLRRAFIAQLGLGLFTSGLLWLNLAAAVSPR